MEVLQLATRESFNGITCDFYNRGNELFMTRSQVGSALEYDNPNDAIRIIHSRHQARLDKFSTPYKLNGVQDAILYSQKGVFEICRWSRQPKADAFMDWVWNIVESYRNGELTASNGNTITVQQVRELTKTISSLSQGFSILCQQVNSMENAFDNQFIQFKQEVDRLQNVFGNNIQKIEPIKETEHTEMVSISFDPIRDTIKPLAELYNDNSIGNNNTYRKVYAAMPVDWNYRKSMYRNKKGNKNRPSKLHLLEEDKKLLNMFIETIKILIAEATEIDR